MRKLMILSLLAIQLAACGCLSTRQQRAEIHKNWYDARTRVVTDEIRETMDRGDLNRAREKALQALRLDDRNPKIHALLTIIYIEQGIYSLARNELHKVVEQEPDSARAHYLIAVTYEEEEDFPKALESYRQAAALDTGNIAAVLAATEVLVAMGKPEEAYKEIVAHLPQAGPDPRAYELAGWTAMLSQDPTGAARYLEQACGLDEGNRRCQELLARARLASQQYEAAMDTAQTLLKAPDYTPPAWIHALLGDCLMGLGRPEDASPHFNSACEAQPERADFWVYLGMASLMSEDSSAAIDAAHKALKVDAGNVDARLLLCCALIEERKYDEAVQALEDLPGKQIRSVPVHCLLGRAYEGLGKIEKAREQYLDAVSIDGGDPVAWSLLKSLPAPNVEATPGVEH